MTRIVLIFGLISGAVAAGLMWIMLAAMKGGAVDHGLLLGYASMVISLSLVFFGVKSFRDNNGGKITFLKGLQVGILISLICALCYAVSWEAYYRTSGSDFMAQYSAQYVEKMKEKGASDAEIAATQKEMADMAELYKNFFVRFGMTLMEIVPVGVVVTLVSAALLRKREVLPATPA
ncbi:MAG TPA: DUF4199 domain-containing protein [Pyrinomonadaceae bacterium]|jgi:hypothetical protein|nr:DUF4199 domain-containing protein [Pyrinomonadaceae bacterium]